MGRVEIFTEHYKHNLFKGKESKSGPGSDPTQTQILKKEIIKLCNEFNIKTFVDFPCGDVYWIKDIWKELNLDVYYGVDIVSELIVNNGLQYGAVDRIFMVSDIVENIFPFKADLLLCRDCLVHLSFKSALRALKKMCRSNIKYLLLTTFIAEDRKNFDYEDGKGWYPIILTKEPFNLPKPIKIINERCTEANFQYTDKCLGLWEREELLKCGILQKYLE